MTKKTNIMADLATFYEEMQKTYEQTAGRLDLSCHGCPDNCCNS